MAEPIQLRCPICKSQTEPPAHPDTDYGRWSYWDCPRCGRFSLSTMAKLSLSRIDSDRGRAMGVSHLIRRAQRHNEWIEITREAFENMIEHASIPSVAEQSDNLVLFLGNETSPGQPKNLDEKTCGAVVGVESETGLNFLVEELHRSGLLVGNVSGGPVARLTMDGWKHYDALKRGRPSGWQAFMAMQYGDTALDKFVRSHVAPAVDATGFTLRRLDEHPRAGLIDDLLRVDIRASRFLIADLSHSNRGAYWEAGFAEGLGKPVIYMCEQSAFDDHARKPHFDTNHHLTIVWKWDAQEDAMSRLKATIRATIPEARQSDPQ